MNEFPKSFTPKTLLLLLHIILGVCLLIFLPEKSTSFVQLSWRSLFGRSLVYLCLFYKSSSMMVRSRHFMGQNQQKQTTSTKTLHIIPKMQAAQKHRFWNKCFPLNCALNQARGWKNSPKWTFQGFRSSFFLLGKLAHEWRVLFLYSKWSRIQTCGRYRPKNIDFNSNATLYCIEVHLEKILIESHHLLGSKS